MFTRFWDAQMTQSLTHSRTDRLDYSMPPARLSTVAEARNVNDVIIVVVV